jgi:hypothetical protein
MLEDYWLPRREGGRGTEVTTLPGGQTLGEMDDVLYFQKKLYQTLNVPVNRLNSDALFSLGRATEVTRDELKFARFISRLRGRFSQLFTSLLEKQLVLKGIMSIEDWQNICTDVKYDFAKDNYFTELKDAEILENRVNLLALMDQSMLLGKYYSHEWVRKNVLHQSDDEIEDMDKEIEAEANDPRWAMQPEIGEDGEPMDNSDEENNNSFGGKPKEEPSVKPLSGNKEQDDATAASTEKKKKIREAKVVVDFLGKKKNKSPSDLHKYQSAVQILARNK